MGKQCELWQTLLTSAPKSLQMVTIAMKLEDIHCLEKIFDQAKQHIKKQRHYFANKYPSSQSYGFPVVTYGCECWIIKKAEHQRIGAFELCCWRRLLRVPWTARRSNQAIPEEISLEYSLEGLMLKLKLSRVSWWESKKSEKAGLKLNIQKLIAWHLVPSLHCK